MSKRHNRLAVAGAAVIALVGLTTAGLGLMWVAGSLGISSAAATQIVTAISVGGLAFALVSAAFSGGILSAITATVIYMIKQKGKAIAVA